MPKERSRSEKRSPPPSTASEPTTAPHGTLILAREPQHAVAEGIALLDGEHVGLVLHLAQALAVRPERLRKPQRGTALVPVPVTAGERSGLALTHDRADGLALSVLE